MDRFFTTIPSQNQEGAAAGHQVYFPDGVTSIGDGAFYCCTSLQSISIPDSVISIGNKAFNGCYSLEGITIPASVTSIGEDAFYCLIRSLPLTVERGSYAETYAIENDLTYTPGRPHSPAGFFLAPALTPSLPLCYNGSSKNNTFP
ncbi:MAG: leucine-rich repeat domain-containing protein [Clostridia bacterium]|nr:leucine-rich repeat domain-containing protein [Clostridia bacterium]